MKKLLSVIILFALIFSFTSCSSKSTNDTDNNSSETNTPKSSLEILENVWAEYDEKEKFAAAGGGSSIDNQVMDAPGKFELNDKEALASFFCIDKDTANLVDDAASLMHMMLANNFTAVALHVSDSSNIQTVATALNKNINSNRWLCGFPEKMYIVAVGDYVVSIFGAADLITTFDTHLKELYPATEVLFNEPIK